MDSSNLAVSATDLANGFATTRLSDTGQPIGFPVDSWTRRPPLPNTRMVGRYCALERLNPAVHADQLFEANADNLDGSNWTYLPYGPFDDPNVYTRWVEEASKSDDPQFWAIVDESGLAIGVASFLRIKPDVGTIEVGHINYSPRLQRTRAATEAMYLMMIRVFDELGYRRYEWKCDALNEPSRRAALRLGFSFEGVFRQATIYKNRNRDTAWFSIIDSEWPDVKHRFEAWLKHENFDPTGKQLRRLQDF